MKLKGKRDLEIAYSMIKWLDKFEKENCGKEGAVSKEKVEEVKNRYKKAIREYHKTKHSYWDEVTIIKDYGIDGWIELRELPDVDNPDEYFMDNYYFYYKPSIYDCTGQKFTSWYKIFKRNGKNMVYHRVAIDC